MAVTHKIAFWVATADDKIGRAIIAHATQSGTAAQRVWDEDRSLPVGINGTGSGAATYWGTQMWATSAQVDALIAAVAASGKGSYVVGSIATGLVTHENTTTAVGSAYSFTQALTDASLQITTGAGNTFASITDTLRMQNRALCASAGYTTHVTAAALTGALAFFASGLNPTAAPTDSYSRATIRVSGALTGDRVVNIGLQTLASPVTTQAEIAAVYGAATNTLTGGLTEGSTSITSGSSIAVGWYIIADDSTAANSDGATSYLNHFEMIYVSVAGTTATIVGPYGGGLSRAYDGANPKLYALTTLVQGVDIIFESGGSLGYTGSSELFTNRFAFCRDVTITGIAGTTVGSGYTASWIEALCCQKVTVTDVKTQASNSAASSARSYDWKGCHDVTVVRPIEAGNPSDGTKPHLMSNCQQGSTDFTWTSPTGVLTFETNHGQGEKRIAVTGSLTGFTNFKFGNPSATDGWKGGGTTLSWTGFQRTGSDMTIDICGNVTGVTLGTNTSDYLNGRISIIEHNSGGDVCSPGAITLNLKITNTTDTTAFHCVAVSGTTPDVTGTLTINGELWNNGTGDNSAINLQMGTGNTITIVFGSSSRLDVAGTKPCGVFANGAFTISGPVKCYNTRSASPHANALHANINATGTGNVTGGEYHTNHGSPAWWLNDAGAGFTATGGNTPEA